MKWSNFTQKYLILFIKKRIRFTNNYILDLLKTEKANIKKFIKENINLNINIKKIDEYENNNEFLTYSKNMFVDYKNVINENINLNNNYIIEWNNNKMFIRSYSCKTILSRIKILILFIEYIKQKTNNKNDICIYLMLTKLKKNIPFSSNVLIDVEHVNSGYTDPLNNIIFIWRLEEFEKVLFHEIIHLFEFDCRNYNTNIIFNINGPHNYYEAITDFWGILYYLIYLSLLTNISIKTLFEIEFTFIKN